MTQREILQRILLPKRGEPFDVCMLYLIESEHNKSRLTWDSRTELKLPAGSEATFETYFNAFPASYWRRWSQLDRVVLTLQIQGSANVSVYRSKIDGTRVGVSNHLVADETVNIELPLKNFEDGGWYWFDITAETDTIVSDAAWCAPHAPGPLTLPDGGVIEPSELKVAVGIPTFNRPSDAVAALQALGEDPLVEGAISHVLMPDQGTVHPADEPGFEEAVAVFGERFREFQQGNLGGSGGYSRIMYEFVENTDAPFVLFMDDDIAIEPDSILRAVQAARFAASPMIVGGQMLNLQERAQLRTMGEQVGRSDFMWGPAPFSTYDHDFSKYPLGYTGLAEDAANPKAYSSKDLHRRIDVDYNGWWMCLFPRVVAETVGQPLPLFIKWDDTEYSLRAAEMGFPTVTWPGAAIWHMAWADKDDAIDWQAYFHLRNRLVTAAMYHQGDFRGIARSILKSTFKHTMCMEYSTMAIQIEALKDFAAGPDHFFDILESSLPRIQKIRQGYDDAVIIESAAQLPAATGANVPLFNVGGRLGKLKKVPWLLKSLAHMAREADPAHYRAPQINLNPKEARWYNLSRVDSATVTTAGGTGVAFRKRNKALAQDLIKQTRTLLSEIENNFDDLRHQYRQARPQLASRESWKEIFDAQ